MRIGIGILIIALLAISNAQGRQSTKNLFGICSRDSLLQAPFRDWFQKNYDSYKPDEPVIAKLRRIDFKDFTVEVFFGTWCGDSRRDVPRFFKIVDAIGLPESSVKLIAVGTGAQYKQGSNGETLGRGIYRVASFIISKNGKEINRITEIVVQSLELDLLRIFSGQGYKSNYEAYPFIDAWLQDGSLRNENFSYRGLARQLKSLVVSPSELNSCGHVLIAQKKFSEAVTVFRMNTVLFYNNGDAFVGLAEAYSQIGQHNNALESIEQAFRLDVNDLSLKNNLQTYFEVKSASIKH